MDGPVWSLQDVLAMIQAAPTPESSGPSTLQWTGLSFVYWFVLMAALTPGNIRNAISAGIEPDWLSEVVRLAGAGILGASATPLLLLLADRVPVATVEPWRNLAIHAAAILVLAPALIIVSCFLAAWVFEGTAIPASRQIVAQLWADFLLLALCLTLLSAIIQFVKRIRRAPVTKSGQWIDRMTISERGRVSVVNLADVLWMETQGNYQALHTHDGAHLLRETSERLAAQLDPARFIRIHRRYIVALAHVARVDAVGNGDGVVTLSNGVQLRLSRLYRRALREGLGAPDPAAA